MCLKGHFGEKSSVNPSQFLLLLKMVWHMHKDDGDKDFQSSLPSNIQFDNFTILCLLIWKIFADHGILCCKCSLPPGTAKIQHGVGIVHFTVVCLVAKSLTRSEAKGDLVMIQTLLLLKCKLICYHAN